MSFLLPTFAGLFRAGLSAGKFRSGLCRAATGAVGGAFQASERRAELRITMALVCGVFVRHHLSRSSRPRRTRERILITDRNLAGREPCSEPESRQLGRIVDERPRRIVVRRLPPRFYPLIDHDIRNRALRRLRGGY